MTFFVLEIDCVLILATQRVRLFLFFGANDFVGSYWNDPFDLGGCRKVVFLIIGLDLVFVLQFMGKGLCNRLLGH